MLVCCIGIKYDERNPLTTTKCRNKWQKENDLSSIFNQLKTVPLCLTPRHMSYCHIAIVIVDRNSILSTISNVFYPYSIKEHERRLHNATAIEKHSSLALMRKNSNKSI